MERFAALGASTEILASKLAAVPADGWAARSVCPDWTVRELANHVIGGAHRYRLLLERASDAEIAASRAIDFVGDDPVGTLRDLQRRLDTALRDAGATDRVVAHRAGETTGGELLGMRVIEQLLHGWDIAASVGGDTAIDEDVCAFVLSECTESIERLRGQGFYDARLDGAGESARARLLALTGRTG